MNPDLAAAHDLLDLLKEPHRGGHHCPGTDTATARGAWVPFSQVCGTTATIATLRSLTDRMAGQVHDAAHDPEAVDVVTTAMLAGTPLDDLSPEVAEGWRTMARLAIEGLAAHLDPTEE